MADRLALSGDDAADALLSGEPLALLIGMVLDQQVPLEWAFRSPLLLKERLGRHLDVAEIAEMDPEELAGIFAEPPALHRFPGSMAKRVQDMCRQIVDDYGGDAAAIWRSASTGRELLNHVRSLPGFGDQKARIFVAFLAKRMGVSPAGWREASRPYGAAGTHMSIADIDGPEALAMVRDYKRTMKAKAAKKKAGP